MPLTACFASLVPNFRRRKIRTTVRVEKQITELHLSPEFIEERCGGLAGPGRHGALLTFLFPVPGVRKGSLGLGLCPPPTVA